MEDGHHLRRRHLFLAFLLSAFLGHHLPASRAQLPSVVGDDGRASAHRLAVYIVHVRKLKRMLSAGPEELAAWHRSFLPSPSLDSGEPRLVFSYTRAISGFAARLTPGEAAGMEGKDGFLYAFPDERLAPQTTHSPDFLRLRPDAWRAANSGEGVVIGVVDSGINPDHASFDGARARRPPRKWRGYCEFYGRRTCSRKLLGARNYDAGGKAEQLLPYDTDGHGTHVAGTAAGREVAGAGVRGLANGTASGAAPGAHLAVYKAATVAETLAAIDQAIADRVDVLCVSMAPRDPQPFYLDGVAIGSLAAVREGVLVVAPAGNYGPSPSTLRNDAPWVVTVGASTTDRALRASLRLGNGVELQGESLYGNDGHQLFDQMPLVYPTLKRKPPAETCSHLRGVKATGKIVLCHTGGSTTAEKAKVVKDAGGVAMVVMNSQKRGHTIAEVPDVDIPTLAVDYNATLQLVDYASSSPHPTATVIPRGTTFGVRPSPAVAGFSSRGPSALNGGVLKPDVLAPGVNILAASSAAKKGFFLDSGTSVAAAHLAGIAAIVNRSGAGWWTPAAIRSAVMTTSTWADVGGGPITDESGAAAGPLAAGAGLVNPLRATDPGLVYDVGFGDYVRYLCGLGYSDAQVSATAGHSVECAVTGKLDAEQLNHPSISVKLGASATKVVVRTLTNARCSSALYRAKVELPLGVAARVSPRRLLFWKRRQRRKFTVTFAVSNATAVKTGDVVLGRLRWSSDVHVVASPLLVTVV
uniref:Subtilisin-like protease n=1 Tax=Anthurium amnicola TaxID=1678845 RepID=A0A1D1ZCI7_9ARAE